MKFIELNARNIVNIFDIDAFLKEKSKDIEKEEIKKWIFQNLKTYIKNELESVSKVTKFKKTDPEWLKQSVEDGTALKVNLKDREFIRKLNHILDYFKSSSVEELSKIKNIDFKEAVAKSEEWTKMLHKNASLIPDESGESIVRKYPSGITWKRLLTVEALETEGKRMDHCVGGDEYKYKLSKNKNIIYSLRDKDNKPHCTIEVEKNRVEQIKGYNDGPVKQKYVKYINNFLEKPFFKPYSSVNPEDKPNMGIIEVNGKDYDMYNLPENLVVNGDLSFNDTLIKSLPNNLTVKGTLDLSFCKIKELPENLTVENELLLGLTSIKELPETLKVGGHLDLTDTLIKSLPKNFKSNGDLILSVSNIKELPENLVVNGDLVIHGCSFKYLPKYLTIKGELIFTNSSLLELPENLTIKKLNLKDTFVKTLPENLTVESLYLNTIIKELPKSLRVTKYLNAARSPITSLPSNFRLEGLNLYGSKIKKLPDNLVIDGDLSVMMTHIESLPNNLTVVGNLNIQRTKIQRYPDDLKVLGSIYISSDMYIYMSPEQRRKYRTLVK